MNRISDWINESSQWIESKNPTSDSNQWIESMIRINESNQRIESKNRINESKQRIESKNRIKESNQRIESKNRLKESNQWIETKNRDTQRHRETHRNIESKNRINESKAGDFLKRFRKSPCTQISTNNKSKTLSVRVLYWDNFSQENLLLFHGFAFSLKRSWRSSWMSLTSPVDAP